jgi:hypothetical protein
VTQSCQIESREQRSATDPRAASNRIHSDSIEQGQIYHERIVGNGSSGPAVATTLDGEQQFSLPSEVDCVRDIRSRLGAHDERGMAVVHSVPDSASAVISEVAIHE